MLTPYLALWPSDQGGSVFLSAALMGGMSGGLGGAALAYFFSRRLFRSQVMREALQEIREPLAAYMDWLATVSGEFSLWKSDLLPAFVPDSPQDQFELNRMRKLFVDQRNQRWMDVLEAYDTLLARFTPAIKSMWLRQAELHEAFSRIFRNLESDPPEAARGGERLANLAFEQNQLVSDFLYHLQYECLKPVASARPRKPKALLKPRIVRTAWGRIKVVGPKAKMIWKDL
jgi:hypothetical protein